MMLFWFSLTEALLPSADGLIHNNRSPAIMVLIHLIKTFIIKFLIVMFSKVMCIKFYMYLENEEIYTIKLLIINNFIKQDN